MLCQWSRRIVNMVNIELFVNINNPSRLQSKKHNLQLLYLYKSEFAQKAFSTEFPLSPCAARRYKPEMTSGNVTVYFSTFWSFKSQGLIVFFAGNSSQDHLCVCACGSCAADWYHKWTIGWKVPQRQMKGRINRRGVEPRWAPGVHRGRSDEEIIEKGSLAFREGQTGKQGLWDAEEL